MTALIIYLAIALVFSFFCSIAEAVLLSVTIAYIRVLRHKGRKSATLLYRLKSNMDAPLAAILSLNTIAHTVGAAGVGAQAAIVFGDHMLGITSAVLTLLILVFSEIIPKTLGTYYWRQLAPGIAYALRYLLIVMAPLVWMSRLLTSRIAGGKPLRGFRREEFAAMARLGELEGELSAQEAGILGNLLELHNARVEEVMTPNTVVFSLPGEATVEQFFAQHDGKRFSRITIYQGSPDHLVGFVLRADLLLAMARGELDSTLYRHRRELKGVPDKLSLLAAFDLFVNNNEHIMYVVNEYGTLRGIITLEDVFEALTGLEIVDEGDATVNMQQLARHLGRRKAQELGFDLSEPE